MLLQIELLRNLLSNGGYHKSYINQIGFISMVKTC